MAFVLALASALFYGGADFLGGIAARRISAVATVAVSQCAGVVLLIVILPLLPDAAPTTADLWWGAAAGLAGGTGVALLYRGLAIGTMAIVAPITAVCAVVVPVLIAVFLGERPAPLTTMGIVLAMVAIALVSQQRDTSPPSARADRPTQEAADAGDEHPPAAAHPSANTDAPVEARATAEAHVTVGVHATAEAHPTAEAHAPAEARAPTHPSADTDAPGVARATVEARATAQARATPPRVTGALRVAATPRATAGLPEALGSGIAIGLFFFALARTSAEAGLWPLFVARAVSMSLFGVVAIVTTRTLRMPRPVLRIVIAAGLVDTLANALYLIATRYAALSIVVTLASLYPASTVMLARVFLAERLNWWQSAGVACALVAVVLIVRSSS